MHRPLSSWSTQTASELYGVPRWGAGYFGVHENGNLTVRPRKEEKTQLEIMRVATAAREKGLVFPMLLRFHDLLRHRVETINEAFLAAIRDCGYKGAYRGVFPIKVNQLREVVEEIQDAGKPYHFGLEAGSKPELLAALAVHQDNESLVICNGYKDEEFINTAMLGLKLGKKVIMVVEKIEELKSIVECAAKRQVTPMIGFRVRLQTRGEGKWSTSSGDNAKFGLSTGEIIEACDYLKANNLAHALKLIHFHIGSQVPDILPLKRAVREAARYYSKIRKIGFAPEYLDVGGGLGVDYDGSRTKSESSMNYDLPEYTRDVVSTIKEVCDEEGVEHPNIVNEGGRAVVAYHSMLLVEVFGSIEKIGTTHSPATPQDHKYLQALSQIIEQLHPNNRRESLHNGIQIKEDANATFELGHMDLHTKAKIENNFWYLAQKVVSLFEEGGTEMPPEVAELSTKLSDQYLCNFSVFQSLIDHWALGQVFPIMPIHNLHTEPDRRGCLVDITCDSDGKINRFISQTSNRGTLPLHKWSGQNYILGVFLVGAYQDVMGDLHNLFGPVNEAHIYLDNEEPDGFYIEETIPGYSIGEALSDVQYDAAQLGRLMKAQIDQAIRQNKLRPNEGMQLLESYENSLKRPTYLNFTP